MSTSGNNAVSLPVIVRVAGLATDTVNAFHSDLGERIQAVEETLRPRLEEDRQSLVDELYDAVGGTEDKAERRFLLKLKRDAYNGRTLGRHRKRPEWDDLDSHLRRLAEKIIQAEDELERFERQLAEDLARVSKRERQHLLELLDDRFFINGVALASPVLVDNSHRLHRGEVDSWNRKQRKLELSLGRYALRSATKLSPYSSLTTVGLGTIETGDGDAAGPLAWEEADSWQPRSLLRIKTYILDQLVHLLITHRPLRETLTVTWNEASVRHDDGARRHLRPGYWGEDEEGESYRYYLDSVVQLRLDEELEEQLQSLLADGGKPYGELIDILAREHGGEPDQLAPVVDRLIEVGTLNLLLPWAANAPWLEKTLLRHLDERAPALEDEVLDDVRTTFREVVRLQAGYRDSDTPVADVRQIRKMVGDLWERLQDAIDDPDAHDDVDLALAAKGFLYEDVVVERDDGDGWSPLVRVPRRSVEQARRSVEPLAGAAGVLWRGHDFLHSLGARLRADGRNRQSLLEVFLESRQLWEEFNRFEVDHRGDVGAVFNPAGLTTLDELGEHRSALRRALDDSVVAAGNDDRHDYTAQVDLESLHHALEPVPDHFRQPVGPCLFLQPTDETLSQWVVNRTKEGTGRFSSRYSAAMSPAQRHRWTRFLRRCGELDDPHGEGTVMLFDTLCVHGDTLNVHADQTPVVLRLPGRRVAVRGAEVRTLADLDVECPADGAVPRIVDRRTGHTLLPVHLGGAGLDFMSPVVKFLTLFGVGEMELPYPARPHRKREDGVVERPRLVAGNVVLHRRSWSVPVASLEEILTEDDETKRFLALHRWRIDKGLPEITFVRRSIPSNIFHSRYKPQYLDLSSPLGVRLLADLVTEGDEPLLFYEALPAPADFPRHADGRRRALELLLESLVFHHPDAGAGHRPQPRRREEARNAA